MYNKLKNVIKLYYSYVKTIEKYKYFVFLMKMNTRKTVFGRGLYRRRNGNVNKMSTKI